MTIKGQAWKFGANVDTDVIIPVRYLISFDPVELGKHCLEGLDPEFAQKVQFGDIIVAAENFGCGSSREHAPVAIKGAGVACVIAATFARIFFRNLVNLGIVPFESEEVVDALEDGDEVELDLESGVLTRGEERFALRPPPPFLLEALKEGSLLDYYKKHGRFPGE